MRELRWVGIGNTQTIGYPRQVLSCPASLLERVEVGFTSCESALPASMVSFSEKITIGQDQFPRGSKITGQKFE